MQASRHFRKKFRVVSFVVWTTLSRSPLLRRIPGGVLRNSEEPVLHVLGENGVHAGLEGDAFCAILQACRKPFGSGAYICECKAEWVPPSMSTTPVPTERLWRAHNGASPADDVTCTVTSPKVSAAPPPAGGVLRGLSVSSLMGVALSWSA